VVRGAWLGVVLAGRVVLAGWASGAAHGISNAAGMPRLLYASSWSGSYEVYTADPSGRRPPAQLMFGRPACVPGRRCYGFWLPSPSPDGRHLLFTDPVCRRLLYVAEPDGTRRRRLAATASTCQVIASQETDWSPDSRRIAYAGEDGVRVVNWDGSHNHRVGEVAHSPAWSPRGDALAYVRTVGGVSGLDVNRRGVEDEVGSGRGSLDFAWSPDGTWLAYVDYDGLYVVHPDGSGRRHLFARSYALYPAWSADSRYVSFQSRDDGVVELKSGTFRPVDSGRARPAWSPHGHVLATSTADGLGLYDAATGDSRVIVHEHATAISWAPDGRSIVYFAPLASNYLVFPGGDLRVTGLGGRTRTVVGARAAPGAAEAYVWTRPPATTRYRTPAPRTLATVSGDQLSVSWPVERLAADGARVAYSACGHVFVWIPATGQVMQADPTTSLTPNCTTPETGYNPFDLYSLAIAGDQVAYAGIEGNSGKGWGLVTQSLQPADRISVLATGFGSGAGNPADEGELQGSGQLLVFSSWRCDHGCAELRSTVTGQTIWRDRAPSWQGSCPHGGGYGDPDEVPGPCQKLISQPGPIVPLDVDTGRIAVGGSNSTLIVDADGKTLLSVPVSPLAAQLSGSDLVVLRQGELLDYNAASGELKHSWPLPNVPSGRDCASYATAACPYQKPALVLEDLARGLVAYTLNGNVRLLRLSDGSDQLVAQGTLVRFNSSGLVYANESQLYYLRFDQLPQ